MNKYAVTIRFEAEGYATRHFQIKALDEEQAKAEALRLYSTHIIIDPPARIG